MSEGFDLDRRVANEVMGLNLSPTDTPEPYSTDLNTAWKVVQRMYDRSIYFKLSWTGTVPYAEFLEGLLAGRVPNIYGKHGETAPEAICRAAIQIRWILSHWDW